MKILFVFTGGTIGSTSSGGCISVDEGKPYLLIEKYRENFGIDFQYDVIQPYTELSENNTSETLKTLICSVRPNLENGYDGIIITHGTDTLQYTASMLSYTLDTLIPVCLVSSNYPIEDRRANGLSNLITAVDFIKKVGSAGVWVPYKNEGEQPVIHRGSRLIGGQAFTDRLYSVQNRYGYVYKRSGAFSRKTGFSEIENEIQFFDGGKLSSVSNMILKVESYPGMVYPIIPPTAKYVLMSSFHSGTVNTKSRLAVGFFKEALSKGVKVFLTGTFAGESYESTKAFDDFGIIPLNDISPISAYIKLWLCCDEGIDAEKAMGKALAGDITVGTYS